MPVDVPLKGEEFRRSVYVQVRRSRPLALLTTFDAPVMELNCERRGSSTVAPQALMLMNSQFILDQAARFADRILHEAGSEVAPQIGRAWQLAFCRPPSPDESRQAADFLSRQIDYLRQRAKARDDTRVGKDNDAKVGPQIAPELQALRDLCQTLLGANEFLYVD